VAQNLLEDLDREEGLSTEDQNATRQTNAVLQAGLGRIYEGLKRTKDASAAYAKAVAVGQKIVALEPTNESAKQALERAQQQLQRLKK
jgi:hypothetical protein